MEKGLISVVVPVYNGESGIKRYSDDGEPQGTAGVPVLDVLEKEGLVDVCVVVTRYFGGILLGGGGLVRAYSHSAKIGVDSAKIITMAHCVDLAVECDYTFYGKLTDFSIVCKDNVYTYIYYWTYTRKPL